MAGWYNLTNRFHLSGLIVSVSCISTTAGSQGVVIQLQTTEQTSYFLTWTLETTLTLISPSPTHGVVTSFHHLLVLVVPLQRGEQTEREIQQTAITRWHNCHCNPTGNGAFWSLGDRSVETPVQIIKEVIGQRGTTERCGVYQFLVQTLFYSAPEV